MNTAFPTPADIWRDYTQNEEPRDFVVRTGGDTAEACVEAHLSHLPDTFGIILSNRWTRTFMQPWQLRRDQVRYGLLAHLEGCRPEWAVDLAEVESRLGIDTAIEENELVEELSPAEDLEAVEEAVIVDPVLDEAPPESDDYI